MSQVLRRELRQSTPFQSPEEEVVLLLQMAAHRLGDPFAQLLRQRAGLTPNQYNVLRILRGAGDAGLPCGEIAERMIARDPDVTRLVDRLVRQSLARRGRATRDRRVVQVMITGAGRALLADLDDPVREFPPLIIGGLGRDRLAVLRDHLEALIEQLGRTAEQADQQQAAEGAEEEETT